MDKKDDNRKAHAGGRAGSVSVVGIGPGSAEHLTPSALDAIRGADLIVGYKRYVDLIKSAIAGKEVFTTPMTGEVERCKEALKAAESGRVVAVVSSGDSGVYGMAGLVLQLAATLGVKVDVRVVPGMPSFVAAAALLGAPLMHDFAVISLSDILTPWPLIEKRVRLSAEADMVIVLYNVKSAKRVEGFEKALKLINGHRADDTPVGIVKNAARDGQEAVLTTLSRAIDHADNVDMLTTVIVGNSATFVNNGKIITPRGYDGC